MSKEKIILTEDVIDKIKQLKMEHFTAKELARLYNISQINIEYIIKDEHFGVLYFVDNPRSICKDFKDGLSFAKLEAKYDFSDKKIKKILECYGVNSNRRTLKKLTDDDVKNIIEDYKSGIAITDLQKKYHIGFKKVKDLLVENNVELKNSRTSAQQVITTEIEKEIIKLTKDGVGITEISRRVNIPLNYVRTCQIKNSIYKPATRRKTSKSEGTILNTKDDKLNAKPLYTSKNVKLNEKKPKKKVEVMSDMEALEIAIARVNEQIRLNQI